MSASDSWDYILKFILIGDSSVGKSSILVRLTDSRFLKDPDPTIGVEFGSHLIALETGEKIKVQVWDTAGSESFRSITRSYYRGAAGALLVYDITHRPSFEHALTWLQDVRAHAEETVSVVLVGNMADKCEEEDWEVEAEAEASKAASAEGTETGASASASAPALGAQKIRRRQVSREEAQAFADREGLMFVETSAKTGQNIEESFSRAAKDIHAKFLAGRFASRSNGPKPPRPGARPGTAAAAARDGDTLALDDPAGNGGAKGQCCVIS